MSESWNNSVFDPYLLSLKQKRSACVLRCVLWTGVDVAVKTCFASPEQLLDRKAVRPSDPVHRAIDM